MREIQRVFKSIVQGPDSQSGEDEGEKEGNKIFDDLHVIICMNTLLQCQQKQQVQESDDVQNIYPIVNYNKLHKMLRNLIIYTSQTVESIQIEVYVQNSDSFIEIINNCLKYISLK